MNKRKIKKKAGGYRVVYIPNKTEMRILREIASKMHVAVVQADVHNVVHGFRRARSPVTNAIPHVGYAVTVSFDLKDCFDHVRMSMFDPTVLSTYRHIEMCFPDGAARQGLPTSPFWCNLALAPLDDAVVTWLDGHAVYTRYADDLSFSSNDPSMVKTLIDTVPLLCDRFGFVINRSKTHVQDARFGRRIVTGIAVDDASIHSPRVLRRRLRAAKHSGKQNQINGLKEAAACRLPSAACKEARRDVRYLMHRLRRYDRMGVDKKLQLVTATYDRYVAGT
jgi:hypothetical protein